MKKIIQTRFAQARFHLLVALFFALLFIGIEHGNDLSQYIQAHYYDYHNDASEQSTWMQSQKNLADFSSTVTTDYRWLENKTVDLRQHLSRKTPSEGNFYFLAIDEESTKLDTLAPEELDASQPLQIMAQGYPFSRELYALIAERLINAGAKEVIFDIFFLPPKPEDDILRQTLDQYRDYLVIGMNFSLSADNRSWNLSLPTDSIFPTQDKFDDRIGFLNYWPDDDGIIRSIQPRANEELINHISGGETEPLFLSVDARAVQKIGQSQVIPQDSQPRLIRFTGITGDPNAPPFPTASLYQIFVPKFWTQNFDNGAAFKDKIVIIGSKGDLFKDTVSTPVGTMPGAELHLHAMNALLHQDYFTKTSTLVTFALILAAALIAYLLALGVQRIVLRFISLLAIQSAYLGLAYFLANGPGLLLPIIGPIFTLNGAALVSLVYDFVLERWEKNRIRSKLARNVSKNLVEYMEQNPAEFNDTLGGVRREVTLLFSDIRGFTSMTEQADPHTMVEQLNAYLTAMEPCVRDRNGFVDKYIGDAVMAYWGAFHSQGIQADAILAVESALAMRTALQKLNAQWEREGKTPWRIGIGLNHGSVIFGNIGSPERNNLTVIGDAVNLAARVESLTKKYQAEILISEYVAELVKEKFVLEKIDRVQVTGRKAEVDLFLVHGPISSQAARNQ